MNAPVDSIMKCLVDASLVYVPEDLLKRVLVNNFIVICKSLSLSNLQLGLLIYIIILLRFFLFPGL